MPHYHAVVWRDHREARIFFFDRHSMDEIDLATNSPNHHLHHRKGSVAGKRSPEDQHFFHDIVNVLKPAREWLLMGPGSAKLELVKHVHMDHRHRHYAPTMDGHCHHLVCRTCGVVVEFSDCRAGSLVRVLARRTKFRIEGHCMDFFGQCPGCLRRSADTSPRLARGRYKHCAPRPALGRRSHPKGRKT